MALFEHFTERARGTVVLAQDEALRLHHHYIGTEHLLLGLLRDSTSVGHKALDRLGVRLDDVRSEVVREVGEGPPATLDERDAEALRSIGINLDEVRRRVDEAFGEGALAWIPPAGDEVERIDARPPQAASRSRLARRRSWSWRYGRRRRYGRLHWDGAHLARTGPRARRPCCGDAGQEGCLRPTGSSRRD
jgi:hypothetical protein